MTDLEKLQASLDDGRRFDPVVLLAIADELEGAGKTGQAAGYREAHAHRLCPRRSRGLSGIFRQTTPNPTPDEGLPSGVTAYVWIWGSVNIELAGYRRSWPCVVNRNGDFFHNVWDGRECRVSPHGWWRAFETRARAFHAYAHAVSLYGTQSPTPRRAARPRLVKGADLTDSQRAEVLDAFVHRRTFENRPTLWGKLFYAGVQLPTDEIWLRGHCFAITRSGRLARNRRAYPVSPAETQGGTP
jgi:hypothetical protein